MYELRVCVTLKCNYRCSYCSKDGEGIYSDKPEMKRVELLEYIENLCRIGINTVRFTGGEPFCRKDFLDLARNVKSIEGIDSVSVVTNGSMLSDSLIESMVCEKIFSYVSVSLDTLEKKKYAKITKSNTFDKVMHNIEKLVQKGVRTRINFVLTKDNLTEVRDILDFCIRARVDIKILDLYNDKNSYVESSKIKKILSNKNFCRSDVVRLSGNLGTPMNVYQGHGIEVIVKDSNEGTIYSEKACKNCKRYPCQLGIVGPIMTHDGVIKVCNLGREIGTNCFDMSQLDEIQEVFKTTSELNMEWNIRDSVE